MSSSAELMYVHNLPYIESKNLCEILDINEKWEELANLMQFSVADMRGFKRAGNYGGSPSEELLTQWGNQNHTLEELFVLLSRMHHYEAMEAIKHLVQERFHALIKDGEKNIRNLLAQKNKSSSETSNSNNITNSNESSKIINVSPSKKGIAKPRVIIEPSKALNNNAISTDNNETNLSPPVKPVSPQSPGKNSIMTYSDISSVTENASIPQISYEELQDATNNWDESNILGKGGFGTVFKGFWKNTEVAIKRIEQRGVDSVESYNTQMQQSLRELRYLNSCRHDNILSLYGFSMGGQNPCLVYQFMSGGSLEQRLHYRKKHAVLNWEQRLNIARGTARGLQYIHTLNTEKPLIHGDIKPANILLDPCSHPRIGDFGLAREGQNPHSNYTHFKVSRVHGTRPYLPDEFIISHNLSTKVDTYSFGVVLYELATGLTAYDSRRSYKFLTDYVGEIAKDNKDSLRDKNVVTAEVGMLIFNKIIELGNWCVNKRANNRPEMTTVWKELEKF